MVKNLKLPFRKKLSRTDSTPKSPKIHLNSEPVAHNTNIFQSEEELYSKVESFLSQSSGSSSSFSDLGLSSSSLENVLNESDLKTTKKDQKMKKKLSEEGNKHIAELIAYLHSDKQLVKTKLDFDGQDYQALNEYDTAVDLDKYFEEKKPRAKSKLWKTPIIFSKKDDKKVIDDSSNGLHSVNRFGQGVADGCSVSLSLKSKGKDFGDVFHRPLEWNDIIEEADQVLSQYENMGKTMNRRARRGSLLQPRIIFLSPHPEVEFERVLQSANCLPLRSWTSELFLDSKESSELLDSETKRNLKWNASVEDFRHLLSPELSHFGNDVYSMLVQAKRRLSLCPPQEVTKPIPFRRNSFRNGEVWTPIDPNKHQKKDYDKKLEVIRQSPPKNEDFFVAQFPAVKSQSTNSLLTVPNEVEGIQMTKLRFNKKVNESKEINEFVSIDKIDPKVVANELTLIAKELLLSIKNTEVINLLIRPHSISPDTCPNIIALLGFQKRIIQLITSYILDETDIQTSANRMSYFIEVAKELKSLRNWHSVYSVISSLQSPPIARLGQCWQMVSNQFSDNYCEFIEISEQIKDKEINPLDYTSPFIPLFNDMMDDLKERCGSKFFEIKKHRHHSNWAKRDSTVAVWVDQQIIDLVDSAKNKKKIQKRVEKIRKNSKEIQNKGILKRIKSKNNKEYSESGSGGSVTDSRTDSIVSWNSESRLRSKLSASNSPMPSCKNIWSVQDFNKLREYDEKEILEEIARGLVHYQRNVTSYYLNDSNESGRTFLLLHPYEEFQNCIKKSYGLEAPKNSKPSKMPQIIVD